MRNFLESFLEMTRGAFSREAAHGWFVVAFAGLAVRSDWLGVTSIIRALDLNPGVYECLLHFFHASSWSGPDLLFRCVHWLLEKDYLIVKDGRIVILGDETKVPKEGRRMPWVGTIRQTSETSSKPSYFRGHEWGALGILIGKFGRLFCAPAWADLMEPGRDETEEPRRTSGIVRAASNLASKLGFNAYLVLDAFYAVGTVFKAARDALNIVVVTRAKSNCRAHVPVKPPDPEKKKGLGRPKKYEGSVKVEELHKTESVSFQNRQANVYGKVETVSIYSLTLFWKPAGALLLFVLAKTSRGTITLICSDIHANPVTVLELYCVRSKIEVMFDRLKNLLGVMHYHFWSMSVKPRSRRPAKNPPQTGASDSVERKKRAISNFVHVGLVLLLFLQAFACEFAEKTTALADCWLRTPAETIPSEFIAKIALKNVLARFLSVSASNPIGDFIQRKRRRHLRETPLEMIA